MDWQSFAAIGIVIMTVLIFIRRITRKRRGSSCGHDCGCGKNSRKLGE
jgi:hypothetical protein